MVRERSHIIAQNGRAKRGAIVTMVDFRAPNEYAFAALFDALAVPYKYEALEPALSRAIRYQPDFWLPDSLAWLEIKPQRHIPTPGEACGAPLLAGAAGGGGCLGAG